jgi:putative tryptophan/tyrosine transport system substrate-binding protein
LRDLDYVEGRNIVVEFRSIGGDLGRVRSAATELVRIPVDVLVVGGGASASEARAVTRTVPIVFATVSDPIQAKLVASLARPGGNMTGLSNLSSELAGKQLELLKTAVPSLTRVSVIYNPDNVASDLSLRQAHEAARALGITLHAVAVRVRGTASSRPRSPRTSRWSSRPRSSS